jgi:hypothetical protein
MQGDLQWATQQALADGCDVRGQRLKVTRARLRDSLPRLDQFGVPCPDHCFGLAVSQGCVPLSQRSLESLPMIHERLFHVEHAPIEITSPFLRPTLNQLVHVRVECLDWKDARQFRQSHD